MRRRAGARTSDLAVAALALIDQIQAAGPGYLEPELAELADDIRADGVYQLERLLLWEYAERAGIPVPRWCREVEPDQSRWVR